MKFKALIVGAVFLGVALGTATPALAGGPSGPVIAPAMCAHHEEHAYVSHTAGSIYVTACALGRGDGGPHT